MICAILPAAGQSRRMGTQKLLLPYPDQPLIAHVAGQILASRVHRLFVVVSPEYRQAIAQALEGKPCTLVLNPESDSAMLASVRCGLRALPLECTDILLAPGDCPAITPALIDRLIAARPEKPSIVIATFNTTRGHPILFSARFRDEILASFDDAGLRGLPAAHPDAVIEVPADDASILHDIDHPADYARALARIIPPSDISRHSK